LKINFFPLRVIGHGEKIITEQNLPILRPKALWIPPLLLLCRFKFTLVLFVPLLVAIGFEEALAMETLI
jgi:hypothetical protein